MKSGDPSIPWPPPPKPTAVWAFDRYLRWLARRHLAGVHWGAAPGAHPPGGGAAASEPVLFVANHTNWWDGFIACLLTRRLGLGFQILMEARHLARYRAFLRVGALPLRRDSPQGAYHDLQRATGSLVSGNGLWVFPQGRRRPAAEPLAGIERGAAHLALSAAATVRICPVAIRYAFLGEQLPEAFALIGESWVVRGPGDRKSESERIEARLRETVDTLDGWLGVEDLDRFVPLVAGRLSVNKRMDRFRHQVGLLRGEFEARNG